MGTVSIDIKLEGDVKDAVRGKLEELLKYRNVVRNTASAVADVLTKYVPRSDRPPSVHHLQDYEARDDGVIRWYGDYPKGNNYAQRVFFNYEEHMFHVRYPGHDPKPFWTTMLWYVFRGKP